MPYCIILFIFQPLVHSIWLYFLLRFLEVKITGGDTSEVCFRSLKHKVTTSVPNTDHPDDEDEDVVKERERVSGIMERCEEMEAQVLLTGSSYL